MMIDPNKTYQTRDGRTVRIYATDGVGEAKVHGAYWSAMSCGYYYCGWNRRGKPVTDYPEDMLTLVEVTLADELRDQIPWEALRPEIRWVAMDESGRWYGYQEKPRPVPPHWDCVTRIGFSLTGVVMPSVDSMRWQETLIERPEDK